MSDTPNPPPRVSLRSRLWSLLSRLLSWHARALAWTAVGLAVVLLSAWALLQFWLLPDINLYRADIMRLASREFGVPVAIGQLEGRWKGIQPQVLLRDVRLYDPAGRPALSFGRVSATLSWWSPLLMRPRFSLIELDQPDLALYRGKDGVISLAGIPLNAAGGGSGFGDWMLEQSHIRVRGAALSWHDALRDAPPLAVRQVSLTLDNFLRTHRFSLQGTPPAELASRLNVSGSLRGHGIAKPENWSGYLDFALPYADLVAWRRWLPYPVDVQQGKGGVEGRVKLDRGGFQSLWLKLGLNQVTVGFGERSEPLSVDKLDTQFELEHSAARYLLKLERVMLKPRQRPAIEAHDVQLELARDAQAQWRPSALSAPDVDLAPLVALAGHLPLPPRWLDLLGQTRPEGRLHNLSFEWPVDTPAKYSFRADFDGLSLNAFENLPGFSDISGGIVGNEKGGTLSLSSNTARLSLPKVFAEPLPLGRFESLVDWRRDDQRWALHFKRMRVASDDLQLRFEGDYEQGPAGGVAKFEADASKVQANAVWRYLPLVVGQNTRDWLRDALKKGVADNVHMVLRGNLAQFPFDKPGSDGSFRVDFDARDVDLVYAPSWPQIDAIDAKLSFHGDSLDIRASSGGILGTRLTRVDARIPSLSGGEKLTVDGEVDGRTDDFLRFIDKSPVNVTLDGFTNTARADGNTKLALKLDIPLANPDNTKVKGAARLTSNRLDFGKSVPVLDQVNGVLQFTEQGIAFSNIGGEALGGHFVANGDTLPNGTVRIGGRGRATVAGLQHAFPHPLYRGLKGDTTYQFNLALHQHATELTVDSTLQGIASELPSPFAKIAAEPKALRVQMHDAVDQTRWQLRLDKLMVYDNLARPNQPLVSQLLLSPAPDVAGAASEAIPLPQIGKPGLTISGSLSALDMDRWLPLLAGDDNGQPGSALYINDLRLNTATVIDKRFQDVHLSAQHEGSSWLFNVSSRELQGLLSWNSFESGRVTARLKRLQLPLASAEREAGESAKRPSNLPTIDASVDTLLYKERNIGKLELKVAPKADSMRIERLTLSAPEGTLKADGNWAYRARPEQSQFNLRFDSDDVGKYLARFGYADMIRRGTAKLEGQLAWQGSPYDPDLATLSGALSLEAKNGQFAKIDPGVGRLLSIISLQSLPRRISLDFGDVFSEGMAFETITGKTQVAKGVMSTDGIGIVSPSAVITMRGEVDVARERQNLRVRVVPALGEGVSIATWAALANPIAGVGALVLQKLLKDPIGQLIAYEYQITGDWRDPKVEKVQSAGALLRSE